MLDIGRAIGALEAAVWSHRCRIAAKQPRRRPARLQRVRLLRADPCSWQHRDKRSSSGAKRPIHNNYDMAAAVASDAASGDSMATAMTGDGETERRWEAFAPHLPHAFADGDRVFVMKSRGGQRGSRPFAAAVVRGEATEDGRRTAVYKDVSTYAARPGLLVPIRGGGPLTLFTATTRAYRLAAATQDVGASVLEIGCDLGETTRRLVARGRAVVAVKRVIGPSRMGTNNPGRAA